MKILFLTPHLPFPANSGGTMKSLKMIEHLSSIHDLQIVTLFNDENQFSMNSKKLKEKVKVEIKGFFQNRPRNLINLFKSYFAEVPMSIYRNQSNEFKKYIDQILGQYDLVIVDHFLMYQYVFNCKLKKIYHAHNAEFLMWKRFSEEQSNIIKKIFILIESFRIKKYESMILADCSYFLAAPNDNSILSTLSDVRNKFYETYHLGDDNLLSLPELKFNQTDETILYVGTLTWEANIHGLKWFLNSVWPLIKIKNTNVKFHIVGKVDDESLFDEYKQDSSIIWHGFVDDLTYFYNNSRVFVAPLIFGSGIKVKVVSALYRGLPTVTTDIGCEGLELENMKHILIANDENKYAESIIQLLNDDNLWSKVSKESREIAIQKYSWEYVFSRIDEVISKC